MQAPPEGDGLAAVTLQGAASKARTYSNVHGRSSTTRINARHAA